jgi:hypothetical protein
MVPVLPTRATTKLGLSFWIAAGQSLGERRETMSQTGISRPTPPCGSWSTAFQLETRAPRSAWPSPIGIATGRR